MRAQFRVFSDERRVEFVGRANQEAFPRFFFCGQDQDQSSE